MGTSRVDFAVAVIHHRSIGALRSAFHALRIMAGSTSSTRSSEPSMARRVLTRSEVLVQRSSPTHHRDLSSIVRHLYSGSSPRSVSLRLLASRGSLGVNAYNRQTLVCLGSCMTTRDFSSNRSRHYTIRTFESRFRLFRVTSATPNARFTAWVQHFCRGWFRFVPLVVSFKG